MDDTWLVTEGWWYKFRESRLTGGDWLAAGVHWLTLKTTGGWLKTSDGWWKVGGRWLVTVAS